VGDRQAWDAGWLGCESTKWRGTGWVEARTSDWGFSFYLLLLPFPPPPRRVLEYGQADDSLDA
jgi:hypothetical protein